MAQRSLPVIEPQPEPQSEPAIPLNGHGQLVPRPGTTTVERLRPLWENRRLLLRLAVRGLLLSALIAFLIPARYESATRLMPPESQSSSATTMLAALSSLGGDTLRGYAGDLGVKSSGSLFIGVLRSRTVEDALIQRFDLRKVYWVSRWEDARRELESRTGISEDRKSGIIAIQVRDGKPERAQAMAKAYVEELDRAVATLSTSAARREREFLETRLAAVKLDLDKAANEFSQFASQNTAIDIPAQAKAMVEGATRLKGELIAAEAERQGLEQIYTANNVRVRAVQARINELRQQLNKLGGADVGSGSPKSDDPLYPSIRKLPLLGVTYADLYRRTKIQEAVYETLTKQYELAKVQEAKEIPTVRLLDPPNYPERRASPPRLAIIIFGFLLSLVAGSAWVLGRAMWEQAAPQDERKAFAQNVWTGLTQDTAQLRARTAHTLSKFRSGNHSR